MPDHTVSGACLCGAVSYQLEGPFRHLTHCHCSVCRKHHGAPFASFVASPLKGFRYLTGEHHVSRYESSSTWYRPFCLTCGSVLPTRVPEHDVVVSPAGGLTGDLGAQSGRHMFVASKAPWYDITDDLPQYAEYPPDMFGSPAPARDEPPAASAGCTGGSCACGRVAFEYEGEPLRMVNCHCSRCRRARSAAHTTNLFVPLDKFRFRFGEELVRDFPLPGARYFGVAFCSACGSHLPRLSHERKVAVIPAASLDADPGMRPGAHVFVGSKASWFEITGDLPQFPEMPA